MSKPITGRGRRLPKVSRYESILAEFRHPDTKPKRRDSLSAEIESMRSEYERLVKSVEGYCHHAANRFAIKIKDWFGDEFHEFLQCAREGAFRAATLFEPERGFKFLTYAKPWIWERCNRRLFTEYYHVNGLNENDLYRGNRKRILISRMPGIWYEDEDGNMLPGDEGRERREPRPDFEPEIRDAVAEIRKYVTTEQWELLRLRFFEGLTAQEIGDMKGCSRELIFQKLGLIIYRIRDHFPELIESDEEGRYTRRARETTERATERRYRKLLASRKSVRSTGR